MFAQPAGDGLANFGLVGGRWPDDGHGMSAVGSFLVEGGREDVAVRNAVGVVGVVMAVLVGIGSGD